MCPAPVTSTCESHTFLFRCSWYVTSVSTHQHNCYLLISIKNEDHGKANLNSAVVSAVDVCNMDGTWLWGPPRLLLVTKPSPFEDESQSYVTHISQSEIVSSLYLTLSVGFPLILIQVSQLLALFLCTRWHVLNFPQHHKKHERETLHDLRSHGAIRESISFDVAGGYTGVYS